ncbi:alpha/beta hydrolase domain-containing protein [Nocardioides acrostichi]|uniref:Alpha/beta hydrolase domain-containing protein n=1 Tax=Nocardioides acrostichi TaxID=2784339 RepID=A0A930UTY8_9ACTN|nr:alpha/beta hydrolase domain-containing protein [Nocardioides acrostichi]MBF4160788.1 hypothetical protein [Nocardioides acrostichi]
MTAGSRRSRALGLLLAALTTALGALLVVGLGTGLEPAASASDGAARSGPLLDPVVPVPSPAVTGPIPADAVGSPDHDYPFGAASPRALRRHGYVEREFFFSGTAAGQPYTSRMVVRRPARARRFSGNVVAEWTNVTNGFDLDCLWARSGEHVMRRRDAYVTIDAQTAGIDTPQTGLKAFSEQRYGSLSIPTSGTFVAEAGSYDIFAQALQAIRRPTGTAPLGPLRTRHLVATGCSQSAGTMSIYANAMGAAQSLADGYLIAALSSATLDVPPTGVVFPVPSPALTGAKVMQVNTETDEGHLRVEPDSDAYRYWEVAGASHEDARLSAYGDRVVHRDLGITRVHRCTLPPFSRIPFAHVQDAAIDALFGWIATGSPPPSQPAFRYESDGSLARDADGNVLGGIRLPEHAVPTATNSSLNSGSDFCASFDGSHVPFSRRRLRELYPSHHAYVHRFVLATRAARRAGVLGAADARRSVARARHSDIP